MPAYTIPKSFWARDWSSRTKSYWAYSMGIPCVLCAVASNRRPWHWDDGYFSAYDKNGALFAHAMELGPMITYLESTDRSWAVDNLQLFCEDAEIEWPPDADMDLYLEQKDQIWDRFVQQVGHPLIDVECVFVPPAYMFTVSTAESTLLIERAYSRDSIFRRVTNFMVEPTHPEHRTYYKWFDGSYQKLL